MKCISRRQYSARAGRVCRAGLDMDSIRKLRQSNPRTAFIFIYHTTKEGNFRGKNENAHEVDVIVEVAEGKAMGNGRFGIGGDIEVFSKNAILM